MTDIDYDIDWENSGNWFGEACDCVESLRAELARVNAKSEERKFWLDSMVRLCWDQYEDMPTEIQDKIKNAVEN